MRHVPAVIITPWFTLVLDWDLMRTVLENLVFELPAVNQASSTIRAAPITLSVAYCNVACVDDLCSATLAGLASLLKRAPGVSVDFVAPRVEVSAVPRIVLLDAARQPTTTFCRIRQRSSSKDGHSC